MVSYPPKLYIRVAIEFEWSTINDRRGGCVIMCDIEGKNEMTRREMWTKNGEMRNHGPVRRQPSRRPPYSISACR
jgi:hypothetical protein